MLNGKGVLLISPRTFGYEKAISDSLRVRGAKVWFIDERPSNDFFIKGLIRVNANLIRLRIEQYYKTEIARIDKEAKIDYVLLISPEAVNEVILMMIQNRFRNAEMILYMWDAIRNKTGTNNIKILPFFDRILSFDKEDCTAFPRMKFRPLFFLPEFSALPKNENPLYDISFIGTIHSDRYAVCSKAKEIATSLSLNVFFYMYLHDKKLYWYSKFMNPKMKGSNISDFYFMPLPMQKVLDVIGKSRCLMDIQHPFQTGLTIRTIETLGARRKLLTTNSKIKDYDFYSESNVFCFDRDHVDFSRDFFIKPGQVVDTDIYGRYSINGWIKDIFGFDRLEENLIST